jgi:hypothetical protein
MCGSKGAEASERQRTTGTRRPTSTHVEVRAPTLPAVACFHWYNVVRCVPRSSGPAGLLPLPCGVNRARAARAAHPSKRRSDERRRVSLRSVSGFFITVVESTSSLIISVLIVVLCGPR